MKKFIILFLSVALVLGVSYKIYTIAMEQMIRVAVTKLTDTDGNDINVQDLIDSVKMNIGELDSGETNIPSSTETPMVSEPPSESSNVTDMPKQTEKPKQNTGEPSSLKSLPSEERSFVMSIYGRFSGGEISRVSAMLNGGLTPQEKQEIKSIVYSKVSAAEISKLYAIADKLR